MEYRALCVAVMLVGYGCVADAGVGGTAERYILCGARLSDMVSSICRHTYNDPGQYGYDRRRVKRDVGGIADECCSSKKGCTLDDLVTYCDDDEDIALPSAEMMAASSESHVIADRSAEAVAEPPESPGFRALFGRVEVRRLRRRRRCGCRRHARRRATGILNMMRLPSVSRGAPVVGTVSPLVVYGTLPDDQPARERFLYVTV